MSIPGVPLLSYDTHDDPGDHFDRHERGNGNGLLYPYNDERFQVKSLFILVANLCVRLAVADSDKGLTGQ